MAKTSCSVCGGGIDTESSPSGMCVRCSERAARKSPLAVTTPQAGSLDVGALYGLVGHLGAPPEPTHAEAVTPPKAPPPAPAPFLDATRSAERPPVVAVFPAAAEPPAAEVGAVPAVEHETPKHEHAKPAHHGKKHG
jgi:hypothetical protein